MDQDPETEVLEPEPPPGGGGPSPLRLGGFVLLGVAAVSAVVGLVSLAGGGENAAAAPPVRPAPTSSPTPAPPPPLAAPPVAPAPAPTTPPPAAPPTAPPTGQPQAGQAPTGQPQPGQPSTGQPPAAAPTTPAPTTPVPATPAPGMGSTQAPGVPTHSPGPLAAPPTTPAPHAQKPLPGAGLPDDSSGTGGIGGGKGVAAAKAPVRVYNNSLIRELAQHAAADFRASGWKVTDVGNYPSGIIPTSTVYYRPGTEEQAAAQSLANAFGLQAQPRFPGIADADPGLIVIVTKDYQRR
ncbi:LytR C-terminal domain-containing protein [Pseudonocardia acaciae]|uniref:LytR C-terminal domain-containing protein n=1 Tax=Pseudonocardia acaciae TaxID=551276 RepID=UPI000684CE6F|nr:LytR C-terminal domain-containing protein [Pseudonocardia acaciae]